MHGTLCGRQQPGNNPQKRAFPRAVHTTYEQQLSGMNLRTDRTENVPCPETMRNAVNRIKPGDVLLCYLTGVMRWVGALEVQGRSRDRKIIWEFDEFPERLTVKPIVLLPPEQGVPMDELEGSVDFYRSRADRPGFNGFLRMSPNRFKRAGDAELILNLL